MSGPAGGAEAPRGLLFHRYEVGDVPVGTVSLVATDREGMRPDALDALRHALRGFAAERDWEQFHTPKNLAMALIVEAADWAAIEQELGRSALYYWK